MRPCAMYRLSGRFEGLQENARYSVFDLAKASGIRLDTLRERLSRKNPRDIVMPSDLAPVGFYRKVSLLLETQADCLSQSWLSKPIVGQNLINKYLEEDRGNASQR